MDDLISGLMHGNHSGVNDGTPIARAWDGAIDRLKLVASQSDGAHTTGLQLQFTKGHIPVPRTLSWVLRIVSYLERPQGPLQKTALGR